MDMARDRREGAWSRSVFPFLLLCLLAFAPGCFDRDGRHSPTNHYVNTTFTIIKVNRGTGSEFNFLSFWVRMESDDFPQTGEMCFLVNGLCRDSDPPITAHLKDAYLEFQGRRIPCREITDQAMTGTVNPRNGETRLNDIRLHFPYDPKLHWGERIRGWRLPREVREISGFTLVVPVTVPEFDPRPESAKGKEGRLMRQTQAVFRYERREEPGEKYIHFGSW